MPRRKVEEKEEELDIKKSEEKETFVTRWFRENAVNNPADMKIVCDLVARSAEEQFCLYIKSGHSEVFGVIFYATYITILEWLKGKQKSYDNFTIEICNSINIGYTNESDEASEKVGNFMPVMEYIGINRNIVDDGNSLNSDKTSQNCIRWKELNIKKSAESYKEIQEIAYEKLRRDFHTDIRTSEAIIPLFCIFMDNLANLVKLRFQEAEGTDISEVSMNVFGLFDIFYSFNADDNEEIYDYQVGIKTKLMLKSDSTAARE